MNLRTVLIPTSPTPTNGQSVRFNSGTGHFEAYTPSSGGFTSPDNVAYVASYGSDGTGAINNRDLPYATIGGAVSDNSGVTTLTIVLLTNLSSATVTTPSGSSPTYRLTIKSEGRSIIGDLTVLVSVTSNLLLADLGINNLYIAGTVNNVQLFLSGSNCTVGYIGVSTTAGTSGATGAAAPDSTYPGGVGGTGADGLSMSVTFSGLSSSSVLSGDGSSTTIHLSPGLGGNGGTGGTGWLDGYDYISNGGPGGPGGSSGAITAKLYDMLGEWVLSAVSPAQATGGTGGSGQTPGSNGATGGRGFLSFYARRTTLRSWSILTDAFGNFGKVTFELCSYGTPDSSLGSSYSAEYYATLCAKNAASGITYDTGGESGCF